MHFHTKGERNKKNQLRHSFAVGFEPVAAGLKGLGGNLRIASTKPKTEVAFLVDIKPPLLPPVSHFSSFASPTPRCRPLFHQPTADFHLLLGATALCRPQKPSFHLPVDV